MKAAITILVILTVVLGATLFYQHNRSVNTKKADDLTIVTLSNRLEETKTKLDEQQSVATSLEKNLEQSKNELLIASNKLVKTSATLEEEIKRAAAAAEAAKVEVAKRDQRISELETQRNELRAEYTKKMDVLTLNIDTLGKQILDTEKKLAASEGDRDFLIKELKRMQAEKAELERQFNDLSVLRTQVAKLKDELSIAKRLEWIRMGIYGSQEKRGAEVLMTGMTAPGAKNYNLNVELKQDGTAVVVPAPTNAPANPK